MLPLLQSACRIYMRYGPFCVTLSSFSQLGLQGHTSMVETDHQGTEKTPVKKKQLGHSSGQEGPSLPLGATS